MILQAGADDLLAVVEIFRPDEADHGVDQQRPEAARHRIGARLQRLLVDAVMRAGGERAALAGLEIHHVVADAAAVKRQRGRAAPRRAARDRCRSSCWRPAFRRSTGTPDRPARRCAIRSSVVVTCASTQLWVGMSSLRRSSSSIGEQRVRALGTVGRGIDADDGVAGAEQQAVEDAGGDAGGIVGRMIGLQPHRQPAGQPDGVAEAGDDRALRRHHHQVLQPADLAHRRRHLRRDAGRERGERLRASARPTAASRASRRR